MERSYTQWMRAAAAKKRECPDLNLIIRHDVDYDIKTCRRMLEIEREHGLTSVSYLDVHSPSYTLKDAAQLHNDFARYGFKFGIHINVMYDYEDPKECCSVYHQDVIALRMAGIEVDSCATHYYSCSIIEPQVGIDLEHISGKSPDLPDPFISKYFKGNPSKLGDGGGVIRRDVLKWIALLRDDQEAFLLTHPVHYAASGRDLYYTKRLGRSSLPTREEIRLIHKSMKSELTPYLGMPINEQYHLFWTLQLIEEELLAGRYRELVTIVDAGCGIGLLGAYLLGFHNVKYVGYDMEKKFVEQGRAFFHALGCTPDLRVANFYQYHPPGDILCFLGYEDCEVNYPRIYEICRQYPEVFITITGRAMMEYARKRGKHYAYISEKYFEEIFSEDFDVARRFRRDGKRTLYHLKRRSP